MNQICGLRIAHPDWNMAQIGREIGVSREWVRCVLKNSNLPTRVVKTFTASCANCGKEIVRPEWRRGGYKKFFCNKECVGSWLGRLTKSPKYKYDHGQIRALLAKGYRKCIVAKLLEVPYQTVAQIERGKRQVN